MTTREGVTHAHKSVIVPVQWLRGVAACLVVVVHLLDRLIKRGAFPQVLPEWIWSFGQIGVGTFFAISGFIMVYTTADEFARPGAGQRFLLRRFLRVAPIYYLTSLLMIAFSYATYRFSTNATAPDIMLPAVVKSFLFIPYIDQHGLTQPVYGLGWTLDYEMFFYLLFALGITMRRGIGLTSAILALIALVLVGTQIAAPMPITGQPVPLYYFTRPVLLYFIVGMAIGAVRFAFGTLRLPVTDAVLCAAALLPVGLGIRFGAADVTAIGVVFVALALALTALLEGHGHKHKGFALIARAFGDASYSMYLTHSFLLGAIAVVLTRVAGGREALLWSLIAVSCLMCAGTAWLAWRWVERPLTRFLNRILRA
ncbi:acyltransferase family protein [Novosphingobium terrae]|uniref:acyltransferase family protein n=1 Tax=Novosphingobium terrae TaxID=2726189 RepID=UPI00198239DA|nr:acyltransferase [Novosphingobium terrae]